MPSRSNHARSAPDAAAVLRPVGELLPHGPGMVLIDRMLSIDAESGVAEVTIGRGSRFSDGVSGVPAHVGIEYLAQTLAAWEGAQRLARGLPVQVGLLLGTRRYRCEVGVFAFGWTLTAHARQLLRGADGVMVFGCELRHGERVLASAEIKAYQPDDIEPYLQNLEKEG